MGPGLLPYQGREANSQPHLLLNIVPIPEHLVSLTTEPRQWQSPSYNLLVQGIKPAVIAICFQSVAHTFITHPHPQSSNSCLTQNRP